MENAKKLLKELKQIDIHIKSLMAELDMLKSTFLQSPQLKEINVQESNVGLKDEVMVKMIMLNDDINEQIDRFVNKKIYINNLIDSIDDIEVVNLLRKRYVNLEAWQKIRKDLHISERTSMRLHGIGLFEINKKLAVNGSKCSR